MDRFEPAIRPDVEKRIVVIVAGLFAAVLIALCVSIAVWPTPPMRGVEGHSGVAKEHKVSHSALTNRRN